MSTPAPRLFQTDSLSEHGHTEFVFQLLNPNLGMMPGLAKWLQKFIEDAVARGTTFKPEETLQIGWCVLRIIQRPDGKLGLLERSDENGSWGESVDRCLMQLWLQQEVSRSVGLEEKMSFPRENDAALVAACVERADQLVMLRHEPDAKSNFSGWLVQCAENHDHGKLTPQQLLPLTAEVPATAQFLALPVNSMVLIEGPNVTRGRIRAHVSYQGTKLQPKEGSYLAQLNSDLGR